MGAIAAAALIYLNRAPPFARPCEAVFPAGVHAMNSSLVALHMKTKAAAEPPSGPELCPRRPWALPIPRSRGSRAMRKLG